tara:strand:+ start:56 stop:298 length:243 start_codon:yes stop_codon:yes gene_type:complete
MQTTGSSEDQDRLFFWGDEEKENASGDKVLFSIPAPLIGPIPVNKLMFVVVAILMILFACGISETIIPGLTNEDLSIFKP